MKALVITNLAPISSNLNSGIFIVRRLQKYEKFNVEFDVVSLSFEDNQLVLLIKKLLKKATIDPKPVEEYENIQFKIASIYRNMNSLLKEKFFNGYRITAKKYAVEIEKILKIKDYDLIHAHGMYSPPAGLIANILSEKYNKPFVVSLHGSDINLIMPKRSKMYVKVLESASANIFVSNGLLKTAKSYGYSGKNAVVIPNGYDEEIFKPLDKENVRKELGIYKEGYKYVGFVGNLLPIKRADKLSEIFNLIEKGYPKTYFIVVGDGPLREEVKKGTEGLNIIFTGRLPQQEVGKWMNAMDVMILPSRNEGWPCVILEAQACGTCVVGSSNGGIPEAIGFPEYVVMLLTSSDDGS